MRIGPGQLWPRLPERTTRSPGSWRAPESNAVGPLQIQWNWDPEPEVLPRQQNPEPTRDLRYTCFRGPRPQLTRGAVAKVTVQAAEPRSPSHPAPLLYVALVTWLCPDRARAMLAAALEGPGSPVLLSPRATRCWPASHRESSPPRPPQRLDPQPPLTRRPPCSPGTGAAEAGPLRHPATDKLPTPRRLQLHGEGVGLTGRGKEMQD